MGTYKEARAPQGAPADGERDVWFADGEIKWGHWDAGFNTWVIDREEDYRGTKKVPISVTEEVTLSSGWTNVFSKPLAVSIRNGSLHIMGSVKANSISSSTVICTLPEAYWPEVDQVFDIVGKDAQLADVPLQVILKANQGTLTMLSDMAKCLSDTALNTIRKMS